MASTGRKVRPSTPLRNDIELLPDEEAFECEIALPSCRLSRISRAEFPTRSPAVLTAEASLLKSKPKLFILAISILGRDAERLNFKGCCACLLVVVVLLLNLNQKQVFPVPRSALLAPLEPQHARHPYRSKLPECPPDRIRGISANELAKRLHGRTLALDPPARPLSTPCGSASASAPRRLPVRRWTGGSRHGTPNSPGGSPRGPLPPAAPGPDPWLEPQARVLSHTTGCKGRKPRRTSQMARVAAARGH